jgi:hypothetical protein
MKRVGKSNSRKSREGDRYVQVKPSAEQKFDEVKVERVEAEIEELVFITSSISTWRIFTTLLLVAPFCFSASSASASPSSPISHSEAGQLWQNTRPRSSLPTSFFRGGKAFVTSRSSLSVGMCFSGMERRAGDDEDEEAEEFEDDEFCVMVMVTGWDNDAEEEEDAEEGPNADAVDEWLLFSRE